MLDSNYDDYNFSFDIYLTDDGSTDNSTNILKQNFSNAPLCILQGDGNLFWNAGMINSWNSALAKGGYDGYLWLNNDTIVFHNLWNELLAADQYAQSTYGLSGIYVGSTCDVNGKLTYGGFNFISRWTLKDKFCIPNGNFQKCQCGHGNVTYISHNVVEKWVYCSMVTDMEEATTTILIGHTGTVFRYSFCAVMWGFARTTTKKMVFMNLLE